MSTVALEGLRDYLTGTLSPSNMLWLSTQLADYAKKMEPLKPYTREEIHARIAQSEREIAEGHVHDFDDVMRELEEEFAREELEMAEAV